MDNALYLQHELTGIRKRLRLILARKGAVRGGLVAGGLVFAFLVASRLLPEWEAPTELLVALLVAGFVGGALWEFRTKPTLLQVARWAEGRLDLKERLSTAVELGGERQIEGPVGPAVVNDAAQRLKDTPARPLYPRIADRSMKTLAFVLALCLGLYFLPDIALLRSPERRAAAATMRQEGAKLEEEAKKLEQRMDAKRLPVEKQVAANLKALGKEMRRGQVGQKESLLKLNKLTAEIRQRQSLVAGAQAAGDGKPGSPKSKLASDVTQPSLSKEASASMEDVSMPEAGASIPPEMAEELMKLASMAKSSFPANSEAGDLVSKLAEMLAMQDFKGASQALNDLASKLQKGDLSAAERKALAQQMEKIAKLLSQSDMKAMAQMLQAGAKALQQGNLKDAAGKLSQSAELMAQMELLKQMMAAAGECKSGLCKNPGLGWKLGMGAGKTGNNEFGPSTDRQQRAGRGTGNSMKESRPGYVPLDGKWSQLYSPRRTKVGLKDVKSPGQVGDQGPAFSVEVKGAPDKANPSSSPYYEVYSSYNREAEKALGKEEIPPAYRKQVRQYFDSLKPE